MKTYSTTTTEMFTPSFDPSLGRKFTGNHADFTVILRRDGDEVTETCLGYQGLGPCRPILSKRTYSVTKLVADLRETCEEFGGDFECIDDLPEGISYPSAAA